MKKFLATFIVTILITIGLCPLLSTQASGFQSKADLMVSTFDPSDKSQEMKCCEESNMNETEMKCCNQVNDNYNRTTASYEKWDQLKLTGKTDLNLKYKPSNKIDILNSSNSIICFKKNCLKTINKTISFSVRLE